MLIPSDSLRELVTEIFAAAGCSLVEASTVARHLIESDLAGHPSHGVVRVPGYVESVADGRLVPGQSISIVTEGESLAVVDGGYGFGQTVGGEAVALGIAKAREQGVAAVGLRHSGHLGRISDWADLAARADLVSIHFVNVAGSRLVAPFGSKERRFGTNPIAIGVPQPGDRPLLIDFATSVVAEGKARVALNGGAPVPDDALVGPDGVSTGDPLVLYGETEEGVLPNSQAGPGALRAMGEQKGSALALACELLAGVLTGSGTANADRFCNGMLSIYLSPNHFAAQGFSDEVEDFVNHVRRATPLDEGGTVVVPGDLERQRRVRQLAQGIDLADGTWVQLGATASRLEVALP
ncbi:MAG: malate dehydrogenase [Actinomycetia bacterium]|nr:malate dehydrogenase [Actinomycetes bacterium]